MNTRTFAVRTSLGMLGVTALSGAAMAISPGGWDWSGRMLLTGMLGSIAGGLTIPIGLWAGKPKLRIGALILLGILGINVLVGTLLIWFLNQWSVAELLGWTLFALMWATPSLVIGGFALPRQGMVTAGWTAIGSAAVYFVAQLGAIWTLGGWDAVWRSDAPSSVSWLLYGSFFVLVAGAAAALCLVRRPGSSPLFQVGALLASAGMVAGLIFLTKPGSYGFPDPDSGAGVYEVWIVLYTLSISIGLTNSLLIPRMTGFGQAVRILTILAGVVAMALMCAIALNRTSSGEPLAGGCAIIFMSGLLATAIIARFQREPEYANAQLGISAIDVTCPRCNGRAQQPIGESACKRCGLKFRIAVEEPRCAGCGHLLIGLTSGTCPECGRLVSQATGDTSMLAT